MNKKGFTIIELTVVMGILSILTLIIIQPLGSVIKYQREYQNIDMMRDNLQFVMSQIERELQTAIEVDIEKQPGPGQKYFLVFTNKDGDEIQYELDKRVGRRINATRNNSELITDPEIFNVNRFLVYLSKPLNSTLITIVIEAESLDGKDKVTMQTSVNFPERLK